MLQHNRDSVRRAWREGPRRLPPHLAALGPPSRWVTSPGRVALLHPLGIWKCLDLSCSHIYLHMLFQFHHPHHHIHLCRPQPLTDPCCAPITPTSTRQVTTPLINCTDKKATDHFHILLSWELQDIFCLLQLESFIHFFILYYFNWYCTHCVNCLDRGTCLHHWRYVWHGRKHKQMAVRFIWKRKLKFNIKILYRLTSCCASFGLENVAFNISSVRFTLQQNISF